MTSCPSYSCGQSAKIYSSYIEALDTEGEQPQELFEEPFLLLRGTLTNASGKCRGVANLSLEVKNGGFVGVVAANVLGLGGPRRVVCEKGDLLNARFDLVQRLRSGAKIKATIEIAQIRSVETVGTPRETLPTYDLVVRSIPSPLSPGHLGAHICAKGHWLNPLPSKGTHHTLLVQGETYHRDATVRRRGSNWFNFGCAGSALAKMRLYDYDPMKNKTEGTAEQGHGLSTIAERQATLKMLTAKYCGEPSWTKDGTRIFWLGNGEGSWTPPRPGWPSSRKGPIESRWGAKGALCISHLRLWSVGSKCAQNSEAAFVAQIQRECGIDACDEISPCGNPIADATGKTVWRTCTSNHVPHAGP